MSITEDFHPWPGNTGKYRYYYYNNSTSSSRDVKGQLILSDHSHDFQMQVLLAHSSTVGVYNSCQGAETSTKYVFKTEDTNALYAKLQGKLRSGSAGLGMGLATMSQSLGMVTSKLQDINHILQQTITRRHRFVRNVSRRRRGASRQLLANEVLEVEFGWKPFFQDIFQSMTILTSPKSELLRARCTTRPNPYRTQTIEGEPRIVTEWGGSALGTACGTYAVTNPNLWLANQLGLINPVAIAVDRIPWSWVVGMFVNLNQMIGSLTDTVGLDLVSGSMTLSSKVMRTQTKSYRYQPNLGVTMTSTVLGRHRSRVGLSNLRPQFQLKLPEFNLELAVITSALTVQRCRTLGG